MRSLTAIATIVVIAALTGGPAFGHPDVLGTPDPSWQNAAKPATVGAQTTLDGRAGSAGATHPWLLQGYVYVAGALFLLLALSLLRSLWLSSRHAAS